jgi:pyruvate-formate lyase-activating enzyme
MSAQSTNDIENRFSFHPAVDDEIKDAHQSVRDVLKTTAHLFDGFLPDGREKSLALTKLEEAMMWSNAAIARSGLKQG